MPRANRYFIPGLVWHITHRCHKKEFLLKFARDRRRWLQWLFEAKKRYGLVILDYVVTSNHIHLLMVDDGEHGASWRSMQLVAGRTGQEYNQRKNRRGAFWEDRYHATAVESGEHLRRCVTYIDMNMVRAGVVDDPLEWSFCGYVEIQQPRQRYRLVDRERLMQLLGCAEQSELMKRQRSWVEEAKRTRGGVREQMWSESIAVGGRDFVEDVKEQLGFRATHRAVVEDSQVYQLKEPRATYGPDSECENSLLTPPNALAWNVSHEH